METEYPDRELEKETKCRKLDDEANDLYIYMLPSLLWGKGENLQLGVAKTD